MSDTFMSRRTPSWLAVPLDTPLKWESDVIAFAVPGTPTGKGRPRSAYNKTTGRTHHFTPDKTVSKEAEIRHFAVQAMNGKPPIKGPVHLKITAVCPIPVSKPKKWKEKAARNEIRPETKPDIDNIVKLVSDALNQVVYVDDKQVVELITAKHYGEIPQTIIEVLPLATGE